MKLANTLSHAARNVVYWISMLLLSALTLCTLITSYYAEDMDSQISVFHIDPVPLQLLLTAALLFFGWLICRQRENVIIKLKKVLLPAALFYMLLAGLLLIGLGKTMPAADSYSVYALGNAFAEGDLSAIQPTGDTYLSYYPQQIGLAFIYELIIRLWKLLPLSVPAYHLLKGLNVLCACGIVWFQYRTVNLLLGDHRADVLYLLFAIGNLPLLFYTSFVYGEVPSFLFLTAGIYALLSAYPELIGRQISPPGRATFLLRLAGSVICLTLGVLLRKNSLIVIIAVALACAFEWLRNEPKRRHSLLLFALLTTLLAVNILPLTQRLYEHRAGNTLLSGVPAMSYFAMGMQEASRGNGWYNGYNFETYQACGLDNDETVARSLDAIRERLDAFRSDPGYAFSFYRDKLLSQWTDGTYACRQATLTHYGQRSRLLEAIYTGGTKAFFVFTGYCNLYQLFFYLGAACYLLFRRRTCLSSLLPQIGLIAVIGGLLFHTIWEANSRYILPYGLFLLPYAAIGIRSVAGRFCRSE